MKRPFSGITLNPRYAKNIIRNADCKAMYHFYVNSYPTSAEIKLYSLPIQPHPVFKSAVIRSKDPLVSFVRDQTQTSTRPTLNHAICNVYSPNVET